MQQEQQDKMQHSLQSLQQSAVAALNACSWVEQQRSHSADLNQEADKLVTALARAGLEATAACQVLTANTTVGVFGASQAGKSYLVSRMAAGPDGSLKANWDGQEIDFLTHVNPPGHDQEATGFVTRFTHRKNPGIPGYPVRLKVLRECEIAMILINSFFNDLEQNQIEFDLSEKALQEHLARCQTFAAAHPLPPEQKDSAFTLTDAVEVADYIARHSAGRLNVLTADHPFWIQARNLLPQLDLAGRALFFSFFWKECKVFTLMYLRIGAELIKLKGAQEVYAPLGAFVEEQDGVLMQRKQGTIICISVLKQLFDNDESIEVCLDAANGSKVSLPFAVLAAIGLEITFPLSGSCPIDNFDVLDFPGARERRKDQLQRFLDDEKGMSGNEPTAFMREQGSEFIRRGKVAYLFDRYARRRELDALLFCIGVRAQQEVSSIVPILNSWIELNAGASPEERAQLRYPPLLCALTRFDEIFERQLSLMEGGQPTTTDKEMENALERISAQGWLANWNGRPYASFYPARRPNISDKIRWLKFSAGKEIGINPDYQDKIDKIKRELLADELFCAHVVAPEEALESVLSPDGGVDRICRELKAHYELSLAQRAERCTRAMRRELSTALDSLDTYARPEGEAALAAFKEQALSIGRDFLQLNQVSRVFGLLRAALTVPLEELQQLYKNNFAAGSNAPRYARDALQLFCSRISELPKSTAGQRLAREVAQAWEQKQGNLTVYADAESRFSFFKAEGGAQPWKNGAEVERGVINLLKRLCVQILDLARSERCALEQRLRELLQGADKSGAREDLQAVQATLCCRFLGDFVARLGCDYLSAGNSAQVFFKPGADPSVLGVADLVPAGEALPQGQHLCRMAVKRDPMNFAVPDVDGAARRSELKLACDFFNALAFAMLSVNALGAGGADSEFTPDANRELLAQIAAMRSGLEAHF